MIHDDQGGAFSHNGLDFSLSPHVFKINDYNIFKFGLGATISQYHFNIEDLINLEDADPSLSQNQVNNNYNFSFGINYNFQKKTNFFLVGLSSKNLIVKDNLLESSLLINYRKNDKLEIYNYLKFRGNNPFQNDLIANYVWNQIKVGFFSRYFFNSSYFNSSGFNSFGFILSFNAFKKMDITYSTDFGLSQMQSHSSGTHELSFSHNIQNNLHTKPKENKQLCQSVTGISIVDPNNREKNRLINEDEKVEFNLVDDELVNYEFNGFEFLINQGKYNEENISYEIVWKDGFAEEVNTLENKKTSISDLIKIENIIKFDKVIIEITKVCNSLKSEVYEFSVIPN
tara:strand:+ start:4746 stop:5771 length:1026 start_codon:yes stop_codon:yes gene_type:complete